MFEWETKLPLYFVALVVGNSKTRRVFTFFAYQDPPAIIRRILDWAVRVNSILNVHAEPYTGIPKIYIGIMTILSCRCWYSAFYFGPHLHFLGMFPLYQSLNSFMPKHVILLCWGIITRLIVERSLLLPAESDITTLGFADENILFCNPTFNSVIEFQLFYATGGPECVFQVGVSSANVEAVRLRSIGISKVQVRYSTGPKTLLCGT